ncbi:MAG: T9SS C-terminal target domain-containing protein [Prevotellaceae bacterium]|nr:T9SS C-terminal target domain-containing protein [Prevotellaceae bacterium]
MKKLFILFFSMLAASNLFAQLPQFKVDICQSGRQEAEVLEPGYLYWSFKQGKADSMQVDGVTFVVSVADGDEAHDARSGWNKTLMTNADAKAKNGRLLADGVNLDPNECGELRLTIKGLPVGTHTIQTFHNRWQDPKQFNPWPITVTCNGQVLHSKVETTLQEVVTADATVLTSTFTIEKAGDNAVLSFITNEDEATLDPSKTKYDRTPILNGFELNTVSATEQAKRPTPNSGDMHVDCDNADHSCTLMWSPSNASIKQHILYFGLDSATVADMTEPLAVFEYADTTYMVKDLYSMNTYYWRVDEVDANGTVTAGNVWSFRPRQLAFPGAEGYGRFATGGRGGVVYHVTNLSNNLTPGSLRYGMTELEGPRTIVFDVSGLIVMDFGSIFCDPYVTLAPQTAPGKGICLKYSNLNIGKETICRFLRARRGYGDTGNAMGMTGADHAIVDHTTAAWGTDETFSSRGAKNISFQYNIIAEALGIADHKNYSAGTNHGFAATIDGKIGSHHHNLLVNCNGRNWSMGGGMDGDNRAIGQMDLFNNVCYNWNGRTTDGGCHEVNFVNNYYKMGPDTKRTELFIQQYENVGSIDSKWQAYISGNIRENKNHTLTTDKYGDTYKYSLSNGAVDPNTRTDEYAYKTFVDEPFFPSCAEIHTAKDAFKIVTSDAGATMPCRDDMHVRVVDETINGTYHYVGSRSGIKGEIDHENDCGGFEAFPEETRASDYDTDQDGIPNWFETIVGTDPEVANNNDDPDHDGWTQLEDYLEFISHPYEVIPAGETKTVNIAPFYRGFTKSPTFTVEAGEGVTATVSDTIVTITAGAEAAITKVNVTVTDAEGSTMTRPVNVAVYVDPSGIDEIFSERNLNIVAREFFTIDGKKVSKLQSHEVYLMKCTDEIGKIHTMKVIAD